MYNNKKRGPITLISGPMFSQKTTSALGMIKKYKEIKKKNSNENFKCLVVKHARDVRYTKDSVIITNDQEIWTGCDVTICGKMSELTHEQSESYDVFCISEGHFYPDLAEGCLKLANMGKIVIVEGLNGDSDQKPFKPISDLFPLCTAFLPLTGICVSCYDYPSVYSKFIAANKVGQIDVGGADKYAAVCENCI